MVPAKGWPDFLWLAALPRVCAPGVLGSSPYQDLCLAWAVWAIRCLGCKSGSMREVAMGEEPSRAAGRQAHSKNITRAEETLPETITLGDFKMLSLH